MKQTAFLFLLLLSPTFFAQVPIPREEIPVSIPIPKGSSDNAGYYKSEGKYGFAYPQNNRQEPIYDLIIYGKSGFIVKKGNLYGITDKKGVPIGKIEFDSVGVLNDEYLIRKNGKYGTISEIGSTLLSVKYNHIYGHNDYISLVQDKNGDTVIIYNKNEKVFLNKIESAQLYKNLAFVKMNGQYGVITDKIIVPFEYDDILQNFSKNANSTYNKPENKLDTRNGNRSPIGNFLVVKNDKIGLINSDGSLIYPAENDNISKVEILGYYLIKKENLYSIYFLSSKVKTDFDFSRVYTDGSGYIMAVKNNKSGVFTPAGKVIVPFEYDNDHISQYSGVGLRITKNKKRGIVDPNGNIIVPIIYDDVSTLYSSDFRDYLKVKLDNKFGIVNLKGETIIPTEYDWINVEKDYFKVATPEPDVKYGLYDKSGKVIIPAIYQWITDSETKKSKIIIVKIKDSSYNFVNEQNKIILTENISDYGYVLNENLLLNPYSSNWQYLLYVKSNNGKYGMLNELNGTLAIPIIYDNIPQRFESGDHTYYKVQKDGKFGLINETNQIIIPLKYDALNIDFASNIYSENYQVIAALNGKYGTLDLNNVAKIPFEYSDLEPLSYGLFKAKKGGPKYQIINSANEPISPNFFEEVANFEQQDTYGYEEIPSFKALTFNNGKMKVIDDKGKYLTYEKAMKPHKGYKTFDELKFALIEALDSKEDILLADFVDKIAPSDHLLYYLKQNIFSRESLEFTNVEGIKKSYYKLLLNFKYGYWDRSISDIENYRKSLTLVSDYTLYKDGYITNARNSDHAFGNVKYVEKLLRNSIKINGYWISGYFMKYNFE